MSYVSAANLRSMRTTPNRSMCFRFSTFCCDSWSGIILRSFPIVFVRITNWKKKRLWIHKQCYSKVLQWNISVIKNVWKKDDFKIRLYYIKLCRFNRYKRTPWYYIYIALYGRYARRSPSLFITNQYNYI